MNSLRARVLLAAAVLLVSFTLLTSVVLENAFRESLRAARETRLLGQLYLLMAAAELRDGRLQLPEPLDEPRFTLPGSGLYAAISDAAGTPLWRSPSALGIAAPQFHRLAPGEPRFAERADADGQRYLVKGYGVLWATGPRTQTLTFSVAEDLAAFQRELDGFRTALAGWLLALGSALLVVLLGLLHWGLRPLRRVAADLRAIEAGTQRRLDGHYPQELASLTDNLNALLAHAEARQNRLDHALGDLAHSLKTPLAILRNGLDDDAGAGTPALREQIERMDHIIAHQLQRARTLPGPASRLQPPVAVRPIAERLRASLATLYRERQLSVALQIDPALGFRGTEDDLFELLGNLLENAHKWAATRIAVSAVREADALLLRVEDDGPGIPAAQVDYLLQRGTRADQQVPGHGLGLSLVQTIISAYAGQLEIGRSATLGGARISLRLPQP